MTDESVATSVCFLSPWIITLAQPVRARCDGGGGAVKSTAVQITRFTTPLFIRLGRCLCHQTKNVSTGQVPWQVETSRISHRPIEDHYQFHPGNTHTPRGRLYDRKRRRLPVPRGIRPGQ